MFRNRIVVRDEPEDRRFHARLRFVEILAAAALAALALVAIFRGPS